jgi:hypothetical protein
MRGRKTRVMEAERMRNRGGWGKRKITEIKEGRDEEQRWNR